MFWLPHLAEKKILFLNLSLSKQTRQIYDEIAIRDELIVLEWHVTIDDDQESNKTKSIYIYMTSPHRTISTNKRLWKVLNKHKTLLKIDSWVLNRKYSFLENSLLCTFLISYFLWNIWILWNAKKVNQSTLRFSQTWVLHELFDKLSRRTPAEDQQKREEKSRVWTLCHLSGYQ